MFKPILVTLSTVTVLQLGTSAAFAQSTSQPNELQAVFACKTISDPLERLACYDNSVGRFEAAENSGDIVTVSKTAIEKVERDAFGFNIPSLPSLGNLFGGGKKSNDTQDVKRTQNALTDPVKTATSSPKVSQEVEPSAISSKPKASDIESVSLDIRKTTEFGHNKTRFFMANGQVWEQADSKKVRVPKVRNDQANTAKISKAALGSFLLRVNGKGAAIRVRRVR